MLRLGVVLALLSLPGMVAAQCVNCGPAAYQYVPVQQQATYNYAPTTMGNYSTVPVSSFGYMGALTSYGSTGTMMASPQMTTATYSFQSSGYGCSGTARAYRGGPFFRIRQRRIDNGLPVLRLPFGRVVR